MNVLSQWPLRPACRGANAIIAVLIAAVLLATVLFAACGRGDRLSDLPYFPGATHVGATSFVGEAYGFPRSAWEQIELRSAAPYEQVREFYAKVAVGGWTSTFESEMAKSDGRVYNRYLADGRRRRFYVLTVEERQASRTVTILLRRGLATAAPR